MASSRGFSFCNMYVQSMQTYRPINFWLYRWQTISHSQKLVPWGPVWASVHLQVSCHHLQIFPEVCSLMFRKKGKEQIANLKTNSQLLCGCHLLAHLSSLQGPWPQPGPVPWLEPFSAYGAASSALRHSSSPLKQERKKKTIKIIWLKAGVLRRASTCCVLVRLELGPSQKSFGHFTLRSKCSALHHKSFHHALIP